MNPLSTGQWGVPSLAVVAVLLVMAVLTACVPSLGVGDIALALEATGSTPDAEATRAVATFAAALAAPPAAPPPSAGDETPAVPPTPTATPTRTPTSTETAIPTETPRPTRTPDVAATETALRRQIESAVAATLAAQPTFTLPPTATAASTPNGAQMIGVVVGGGLINLRSGPGLDNAVLAGVNSGEEVLILGRSQDAAWLQVRTAGGLVGWMSALYISTVGLPNSYPVLGYPGR